jgi:uncharacterized membrane protein
MEPRSVGAGQGWQWIADGFGLFRKSPLIWIVLLVIYMVIFMVLSIVPVVGPLVMMLLSPVFTAGFMLGCKALEQGEDLEIGHLFGGFQQNASTLVTVGGLYLVGYLLIFVLMALLGGGSMVSMAMMGGEHADPAVMTAAMGTMSFALLVALALLVPLMMAYWFAPALVVFHGMGAVDAMKLSFAACLKNVVPFLVYGVVALILMIIAAIPLGLGMIVLLPVLVASLYTCYTDIFPGPEVAE